MAGDVRRTALLDPAARALGAGVVFDVDKLSAERTAGTVDPVYDDRDRQAGEKLADADLIGIPVRLVLSKRTMEADSVEWKERNKAEAQSVKLTEIEKKIKVYYS